MLLFNSFKLLLDYEISYIIIKMKCINCGGKVVNEKCQYCGTINAITSKTKSPTVEKINNEIQTITKKIDAIKKMIMPESLKKNKIKELQARLDELSN